MWDKLVDKLIRFLCVLFPSRYRLIPTSTDPNRPLLEQFAILRMGRFGALYLQHFVYTETERYFHRHQWNYMRSFVLSGWFTEERAPIVYDGSGCRQLEAKSRYVIHPRFTTYAMDRSVIHRTDVWSQFCWTLFYMSAPKLEDWGYYDRETLAFTHWRDQIKRQVPSLDTGELT